MIVELKEVKSGKITSGKELRYESHDKYGYVLLDDKLVFTYHPVYTPEELHEYFKQKFEVKYR